ANAPLPSSFLPSVSVLLGSLLRKMGASKTNSVLVSSNVLRLTSPQAKDVSRMLRPKPSCPALRVSKLSFSLFHPSCFLGLLERGQCVTSVTAKAEPGCIGDFEYIGGKCARRRILEAEIECPPG